MQFIFEPVKISRGWKYQQVTLKFDVNELIERAEIQLKFKLDNAPEVIKAKNIEKYNKKLLRRKRGLRNGK